MALKNALITVESVGEKKKIQYEILSMVNTSYEFHFPSDVLLSQRVIFPVAVTQKNGIEDGRFVKFTEDDSLLPTLLLTLPMMVLSFYRS